MFPQRGRDVDGRTAQGDDGLFAAAAFGPVDVVFFAEREPRGEAGLEALDALFVIEELVAFAAVLEGVADFAEDAVDRSEWSVEGGLGDAFLADAHDGALSEQRGGEEIEKLFRGVEGVDDELLGLGAAELAEDAAFGARVEKVFQRSVQAIA